ncbi:MAG: DUF4265 domain-containing protein [Proteobacteria bacterium]|nr:DUF4265 domain-containing protein [Pseudomonadota bacterium]
MNAAKKINFCLMPDADGYPPVSVESLWANPSGNNYVIDSIPFFTSEATLGDLVRVKRGEGDALWFEGVERPSGHSLLRAVFFDEASVGEVIASLVAAGCDTERMNVFKLLAIDVPEDVSLADVQRILQQESAAGRLDYEEPILRH